MSDEQLGVLSLAYSKAELSRTSTAALRDNEHPGTLKVHEIRLEEDSLSSEKPSFSSLARKRYQTSSL